VEQISVRGECLKKRFWSKVTIEETDKCWEWNATKNPEGYGGFRANGKMEKSHRVAWGLMKGVIPDGLDVHHVCGNKGCCRPSHMEILTRLEHCHRDRSGGCSPPRRHMERVPRGEAHYQLKKTHCPSGHEYSEGNTYISSRGKRYCRECRRVNALKYYHLKKSNEEE
jgi:hypothetical protein